MRTILAIGLVVTLLAACTNKEECRLCGKWKSNEARTLAEMGKVTTLTEAQLKFFGKDFFGRLIVETEPTRERSYFLGESPENASWEPWHLISESGDVFRVQSRDVEAGTFEETTIRLDGNCYIVDLPHLGFGEWFCRM